MLQSWPKMMTQTSKSCLILSHLCHMQITCKPHVCRFCQEDIDQILERRTKVIQIESETKGSTFSKASFVADGTSEDLDINDPRFWEKWAEKAKLDLDQLANKVCPI